VLIQFKENKNNAIHDDGDGSKSETGSQEQGRSESKALKHTIVFDNKSNNEFQQGSIWLVLCRIKEERVEACHRTHLQSVLRYHHFNPLIRSVLLLACVNPSILLPLR
jgi:hypothetical protein